MGKFVVYLAIFGLAGITPLMGQYPGGYPPGTYPPGTYPGGPMGGGSGIPIPHRQKKGQSGDTSKLPTLSADGTTVSNDGKKLVISTNDGRTLTMAINQKTQFTRSGNNVEATEIVPRTTVHVEAAEDENANLTAVKIELVKDAPAQAAASAGAAGDEDRTRPTILDSPDAPDRPILHRGKPKDVDESNDSPVAEAKNTAPVKPATAPPTKKESSDDFTIDGETAHVQARATAASELIAKTKQWAMTFTNGLPNYVCQQMTTRYMEQSRSSGWEPLDVITAKVVYEDGKEAYKEITVGGKRTNKSMLELGGSTSTGEFASTLRSLFSDASQAQFNYYQATTLQGTPAAIYDFKVPLRNSDWFINVGGQSLKPAYSGSVWIERSTGVVRRIEMQADHIPVDFPLDSIEWAVDYDTVSLGTAKFLLPVHAENLACQRGSSICTKNATDFRDYHKFAGESTITFEK
ncbi:MAG TPA: hypothetical protein VFB14_09010 [Bryobacteraceae bacterium]|jgi:hypothetical protein|nr:hypothetical protein [Bryobacteraceae bacterium]